MSLRFGTLREANVKRLPQFKNAKGEAAHPELEGQRPGSDWSPAQWLQAVVGELGEYANLRKKVERGDIALELALPDLADELADVLIYLDILAFQLGIDLGAAVIDKWNRTSERVGSNLIIHYEGHTVLGRDIPADWSQTSRDDAPYYYLPNSGGSKTGPQVKEGTFFRRQGGLTEEWGQSWEPLGGVSNVKDAKLAAAKLTTTRSGLPYDPPFWDEKDDFWKGGE